MWGRRRWQVAEGCRAVFLCGKGGVERGSEATGAGGEMLRVRL